MQTTVPGRRSVPRWRVTSSISARMRGMPRDVFGEKRLLDLLASCAGFDAATIVSRVGEELDWLADESRRDDAAMLVVRVPPA